jgi:hypothetical protein
VSASLVSPEVFDRIVDRLGRGPAVRMLQDVAEYRGRHTGCDVPWVDVDVTYFDDGGADARVMFRHRPGCAGADDRGGEKP